MTTLRRFNAVGPASGSTGAGLKGGSKGSLAEPGKYLVSIEVSLVDKASAYQTAVYAGEVLVELALVDGRAALGTPVMSPSRWHDAVYVSNGAGALVRPNLWIPEDGATLIARVWHRDDVTGAPWSVKVTATYSEAPFGGSESAVREAWSPYTRTGTDPGADTEAEWVCPEGILVRPSSFNTPMVFGAAVATRYPGYTISLTNGGVVVHAAISGSGQLISTSIDYAVGAGTTAASELGSGTGIVTSSFPVGLELKVGNTIETKVLARNAADNWGAMTVKGVYRVVMTEAAS